MPTFKTGPKLSLKVGDKGDDFILISAFNSDSCLPFCSKGLSLEERRNFLKSNLQTDFNFEVKTVRREIDGNEKIYYNLLSLSKIA